MRLVEGEAEQAELGIAAPHVAAPALRRLLIGAPLLETVTLAQEARDARLHQPLVLVEIELHDVLRGPE